MTGNALTQTAERPLSLSECRISARLRTLLCDDLDRLEAIADIAADPVMREEVRVSLPLLERTILGAGPEVVKNALGPLVLIHEAEVGARAKVAAWWRVYFDQLADLPAEAIHAAAREYPGLPDAEFFPKPHRLRALATKHARSAFTAVGRARAALKTRAAA